jgi:hypothetical protein
MGRSPGGFELKNTAALRFQYKTQIKIFSRVFQQFRAYNIKNCTCPVLETTMYEGSMFLPTSA